jgi:very-short-patch-repair endonuclease
VDQETGADHTRPDSHYPWTSFRGAGQQINGKDEAGKLSHNFGPLNQEGGERRLNVAVTRAKYQVIVVSSIRAADIDTNRAKGRGAHLLKRYLDFAERGIAALSPPAITTTGEAESPFEEEVAEAVRRAGYVVEPQVGCSGYRIDIGVLDPEKPGRYVLGIECDGATYHSSKTARDRDRLRQKVLEDLGWRIHRIWSTDWIRDPERELGHAVEAIEDARRTPASRPTPTPDDSHSIDFPSDSQAPVSVAEAPVPPRIDGHVSLPPYDRARLERIYGSDVLSAPIEVIAQVVTTCVEHEGPIHDDLLKRRVAAAWGNLRVGPRIDERIGAGIRRAKYAGWIEIRGAFAWPVGMATPSARGPSTDGEVREIAHVAPEELVAVVHSVVNRAFSISQEGLIQSVARSLGYQRTGPQVSNAIRAAIESAVSSGTISRNGDLIVVSDR